MLVCVYICVCVYIYIYIYKSLLDKINMKNYLCQEKSMKKHQTDFVDGSNRQIAHPHSGTESRCDSRAVDL